MSDRSSPVRLIMSLIGFGVFMVAVLATVGGFGVGAIELAIWMVFFVVGVGLIVGRFRATSSPGA